VRPVEPKPPATRDPAPGTRAPGKRGRGILSRRGLLRFWLPAALIGIACVVAYHWQSVSGGTRTQVDALRTAVIDHPEFAVTDLEIGGHIQLSVHDIGRIIGIAPGTTAISSLRFDARRARMALLDNPWIERASVSIDPSGVMKIVIDERIPAAIWRNDDGFFLIDDTGHRIVPVPGADARLDLPLLIGPNANTAVQEAQALVRGAPVDVLPRISALVRRGGRRWDVITDGGLILKLPAENPLDALRLFADLRLEEELAPFAVTGVDLRLPDDPPVIRLEEGASAMRDELLETLRTTYR